MVAANNVLIVGGGIAGHTLACALHKRGISCEIVEIQPDWRISGSAMTIQPNALRAFRDIGVVEAIAGAGWHRPDRHTIFTDVHGELVFAADDTNIVGPNLPPMVAIRRQALHDVLAAALAKTGVKIRMSTTVQALDDRGDFVDVTFSDGTSGRYDLVVGADGIRSKIRGMVFGLYEPKLAGFGSWRGLLPLPQGLTEVIWMWGHSKTLGLVPVGPNTLYFAGVTKEDSKTRYRQEDLPRLFREKFRAFHGRVPEVLASISSPDQLLYTAMEEVHLPAPWYKGRVMVLGDAAHAACPFWAQGAAMAIEDTIVLAEELVAHPGPAAALPAWQTRRFERCMFVQRGSFETGVQLHQDKDDDSPKIFPPPVKEIIRKQSGQRAAKLAEPI
jgi:2-polyprenyl-6-methoxyphenol hydroxylase-like FAD-dependent oxidoreductase